VRVIPSVKLQYRSETWPTCGSS